MGEWDNGEGWEGKHEEGDREQKETLKISHNNGKCLLLRMCTQLKKYCGIFAVSPLYVYAPLKDLHSMTQPLRANTVYKYTWSVPSQISTYVVVQYTLNKCF